MNDSLKTRVIEENFSNSQNKDMCIFANVFSSELDLPGYDSVSLMVLVISFKDMRDVVIVSYFISYGAFPTHANVSYDQLTLPIWIDGDAEHSPQ